MTACGRCHQEIADEAAYCSFCGAAQRDAAAWRTGRYLRRSADDKKLAGVCGGIGEYVGLDPTLIRLIWIVLAIFPGAVILGFFAYLLAWLIMPPGVPGVAPAPVRRLRRSDRRIAGVCGGLAEYLRIDPTALRVLWVVFTIVPGFILGGILTYVLAWIVIPPAPQPLPADVAPAGV
jgi:phage shock protein PspC (stress-responsive transcriptional regulator)